MKEKLLKKLGGILGKALIIVLVIVLLPYASRLAERFLSDHAGQAINTSVILSEKLSSSARLETTRISAEGVLDSSTEALALGRVQHVQITYTYEASIGIDLSRVGMKVNGNEITFVLPKAEILQDSLTPGEIVRDDFWYPLTDSRREKLLAEEKERCRERYLTDTGYDSTYWSDTVKAFEETIAAWINFDGTLTFRYEQEATE